ncbi:synaptotagmin-like protein 2 isoform X14 [Anguilla anguilla]|uniref:synaptotagmin-like protein 2 isoform X14 n=1 Tax=Anguilla anguilla TaxID=7936 RepID=UPI0015AFFA83|nr:synaptotagmin-like protein 2 isoform X14 [Anguilla anguilla]
MIDLSHLTEGEQEMIVSVLKRDAELKKADEERIRRLRKAAQDTGKLKYLTGEWFYQTKSQRHRDRIHGSDIIRAAMKQRKPMTILEITQIWAERPSFVNSEIQDIFVPAELSGLIEEPSTQATEKRASGSVSPDVQKDGVILALQSPPKIRRNPFNSVLAGSEASEEPEPQFTNWEAEPITPSDEVSPVSTSPSSSFSDQDQMKKRCASMPAFLHGEASSSLMSIYSLEFENVEVKGTIQFALSYVQKLGELHVFVVRCRDLAVADTKKNRSDPYVKSYLLPDKAKLGKKKTTVKKKTLNPIYNEILRYKIDVKTLKSHTLNLSVWHHNSFGKNSFLGEVDFKLSEWDLTNTHMNDFTLKGKSPSGLQPTDHRGEIRVALRFLQQGSHGKRTPKTGLVQIFVKDCKNLPFIRGAVIDPFVKCYVLPDTSRKSRQKSRVLRKTANPVFNHTMVYDGFRAEDLEEACVELTVWDHDRLNNHFLGGVRLSLGTGRSHGAVVDWMDSNAAEAMLWKQMMESHNEWVEDVLPLRMLMMAHSMSK